MKNEYGLDTDYFSKLIKCEFGDISRFKPDEFARVCLRMANTADSSVINEPEFSKHTKQSLADIRAEAVMDAAVSLCIKGESVKPVNYTMLINHANKIKGAE